MDQFAGQLLEGVSDGIVGAGGACRLLTRLALRCQVDKSSSLILRKDAESGKKSTDPGRDDADPVANDIEPGR